MARKNPPLLVEGPLSGDIFIVTRYTTRSNPNGDTIIVSQEKYDATEQFEALARQRTERSAEANVELAKEAVRLARAGEDALAEDEIAIRISRKDAEALLTAKKLGHSFPPLVVLVRKLRAALDV